MLIVQQPSLTSPPTPQNVSFTKPKDLYDFVHGLLTVQNVSPTVPGT